MLWVARLANAVARSLQLLVQRAIWRRSHVGLPICVPVGVSVAFQCFPFLFVRICRQGGLIQGDHVSRPVNDLKLVPRPPIFNFTFAEDNVRDVPYMLGLVAMLDLAYEISIPNVDLDPRACLFYRLLAGPRVHRDLVAPRRHLVEGDGLRPKAILRVHVQNHVAVIVAGASLADDLWNLPILVRLRGRGPPVLQIIPKALGDPTVGALAKQPARQLGHVPRFVIDPLRELVLSKPRDDGHAIGIHSRGRGSRIVVIVRSDARYRARPGLAGRKAVCSIEEVGTHACGRPVAVPGLVQPLLAYSAIVALCHVDSAIPTPRPNVEVLNRPKGPRKDRREGVLARVFRGQEALAVFDLDLRLHRTLLLQCDLEVAIGFHAGAIHSAIFGDCVLEISILRNPHHHVLHVRSRALHLARMIPAARRCCVEPSARILDYVAVEDLDARVVHEGLGLRIHDGDHEWLRARRDAWCPCSRRLDPLCGCLPGRTDGGLALKGGGPRQRRQSGCAPKLAPARGVVRQARVLAFRHVKLAILAVRRRAKRAARRQRREIWPRDVRMLLAFLRSLIACSELGARVAKDLAMATVPAEDESPVGIFALCETLLATVNPQCALLVVGRGASLLAPW
mmetsp:Transcript_22472/g.67304  ORF Transcript_22472/g.67304 Transcript_22472/m.67304 type:complete len:623 (-) Transcript_22472:3694-5562(-)